MSMQMPGPRDILNLLARPTGIFCCAKALGLGTHFGAKALGCPGGGDGNQSIEIDTCITSAEESIVVARKLTQPEKRIAMKIANFSSE